MKSIAFAEGSRLPIEIATSPVAFLGGRGRGKTRGAMTLAAGLFEAGVPPVILDSVGIWYGLRLARDGKSPGLAIPILGGFHADAPLLSTAGKVVAEALVRTNSPCILDTTAFESQAEVIRFMQDFAATFYRQKMRHPSPVHLFLEEADEWVPQMPQKNETRMLGAFQQIARVGRNFGIGFTVISQRPQGISKKVLNLADVLIVLGFNGKHERDAIADWMKDKELDVAKRQEALDTLPRLGWNKVTKKDGGALIWAPMLDLFGIHKLVQPETFDSSATPAVGAAASRRDVGTLDIGALGEAMSATLAEAKANDPGVLRQEISRLKAELARKPGALAAKAAPPVEIVVPAPGLLAELTKATLALTSTNEEAWRSQRAAEAKLQAVAEDIRRQVLAHVGKAKAARPNAAPVARAVAPPARRAAVLAAVAMGFAENLSKGERKILSAIAQHPDGVSREHLTVLLGYKKSSRDTYLKTLRARGSIEAVGDRECATEAGVAELGDDYEPLPVGGALREHWMDRLPAGERKILEVLVDAWPEAIGRDELDEPTGYKKSSRDTYLKKLSARRLVEAAGRGVKASNLLFDGGA